MKLLLAANHPPGGALPFGGVQSWISTVARRLIERGHSVSIWGEKKRLPKGRFDVGIIAHYRYASLAVTLCDRVISVSHGVVKDERPCKRWPVVCTSEEVRDYWGGGEVIRQPIDLDFWSPQDAREPTLVFYSYRAPESFGIEHAAAKLGLRFKWLKDVSEFEARKELGRATAVCASGRAALEAMSCGVPTLICDWRPYQNGPLMCEDFGLAMRNNYSGRCGEKPTPESIAEAVSRAMALQFPRAYIAEFHDSGKITGEILSLC